MTMIHAGKDWAYMLREATKYVQRRKLMNHVTSISAMIKRCIHIWGWTVHPPWSYIWKPTEQHRLRRKQGKCICLSPMMVCVYHLLNILYIIIRATNTFPKYNLLKKIIFCLRNQARLRGLCWNPCPRRSPGPSGRSGVLGPGRRQGLVSVVKTCIYMTIRLSSHICICMLLIALFCCYIHKYKEILNCLTFAYLNIMRWFVLPLWTEALCSNHVYAFCFLTH